MRIRNIIGSSNPAVVRDYLVALRQAAAGDGVTVDTANTPKGPFLLESTYEERLATPHILETIGQAQNDGYNAVTLDCFGDPAKEAARELVDIPVVGSREAGMLVAMALGDKVSVITVKSALYWLEKGMRAEGFRERVASVRAVDIDLKDLVGNPRDVEDAFYHEARKAIEEDGAHVIVLGCTGMSASARPLMERLGVPVVDPASCAIKLARSLVEMELSHSRRCYPHPPSRDPKLAML